MMSSRGMPVSSQSAKGTGMPTSERSGGALARRNEQDSIRFSRNSAEPGELTCVIIAAGTVRNDVIASVRKVIWSEILAYISFYRNKANSEALVKVVLNFFSPEIISDAKKLLTQEFQSVSGVGPYVTDRRNSTVRLAHEAEIEDILGIMDAAELKQALNGYRFMASDLNEIPKFGPEEINLAVVVDRQVRMETVLQSLSDSMQRVTSGTIQSDATATAGQAADMQHQLDEFKNAITSLMDHLNAVCSQLADNVRSRADNSVAPPTPMHGDVDRSMNIVVFGVAEDREPSLWRKKVEDVLRFVVGHEVDTVDMFRIGRFATEKLRPIIVKLRTVWDKRTILSNSRKLKDYDQSRPIFISPDEAIEVRRKRMLDRVKFRAEHEGKVASINNGVLAIDGVNVFSLKDGKLN